MFSIRKHYANIGGYKLKKPTTAFMFFKDGNLLKQKGVIVTRNAYSKPQAVRFLKHAFPSLQYVDIVAKEYQEPKPPPAEYKPPVTPPPKPEQLNLNI